MTRLLMIALLFALVGCRDKEREREEMRKKQAEILRQQSSKWTEEQKNYRLPDLNPKKGGAPKAQKNSEQKGNQK